MPTHRDNTANMMAMPHLATALHVPQKYLVGEAN
eukprot:COSAG01_NODE_5818_length_4014_cov_29.479183_3_plen_34_part_00